MKNKKIFYGWIVLLACCIANGVVGWIGMISIGLFVAPAIELLNVSVASFMICATATSIGSMLVGPIAGKLVDKKGIRLNGLISGILMVLAFLILSRAQNVILFYVGYFTIGVGYTFGTNVVVNCVATKWFRRYSGIANGFCAASMGVAGVILSPVIVSTIAKVGLSNTYMILGGVVAVCGLLIPLILYRNTPEDMGLLPDGEEKADGQSDASCVTLEGMNTREAMRSRNFWLIALAFSLQAFTSLGVVQTYNASLQSVGFSAVAVAGVASLLSAVSIISRLVYGRLSDKLSLSVITIIPFALAVIGDVLLALTQSSDNTWILIVFPIISACSAGYLWTILIMKDIAVCFGIKNLGAIFGAISFIIGIFGMFGAVFAGAIFDANGSYAIAYWIFAAVDLLSMILLLLLKKPEKK